MFWLIVFTCLIAALGYHALKTYTNFDKRISIQQLIDNPKYDLKTIVLPALQGKVFYYLINILEFRPITQLLLPTLIHNAGFSIVSKYFYAKQPTYQPIPPRTSEELLQDAKYSETKPNILEEQEEEVNRIVKEYEEVTVSLKKQQNNIFTSIVDLHRLYKEKKKTPLQVAEQLIKNIKDSDQINNNSKRSRRLRAFIKFNENLILEAAKKSTERFEKNEAISVFDGVPIGVKDELDVAGFTTTKGMLENPYNKHIITLEEECNVTRRLRQLGAIIVGKTNQNEIGISPRGFNVGFGSARNPYNLECETGGSSSGSAASVASGLVPLAIGTDGGGSIRVPSSLCGAFGLKPTQNRLSASQTTNPICYTVGVAGPICTSAIDLTISYAVAAGRRDNDKHSFSQPRDLRLSEIKLGDKSYYSLSGMKIGIYEEYFNHVSDPRISKMCMDFIKNVFCSTYNAEVDNIVIPLLEISRVSHLITIASEMRSAMGEYGYYEFENRSKLSPETRMSLLTQVYTTSEEYLCAQKVKTYMMDELEKLFKNVNVIATPTCACVAQKYCEGVEEGDFGESNYTVVSDLMRYVYISNFCGNPAVTIPIGYIDGMPVGLQLMSKWYDEVTLLKFALLADLHLQKEKPQLYYGISQ
ncbi:hypothetical protein ABK040_011512 [Willaertia magna]